VINFKRNLRKTRLCSSSFVSAGSAHQDPWGIQRNTYRI